MNISQYEILGLFSKIDNLPLDTSTRALMVAIISFYNSEKGFAFPSIKTLVTRSGLSERTIDRCKKELVSSGWMTIEMGTGKGVSNKYFINIHKIISSAKESGTAYSGRSIPKHDPAKPKETHKRNTSGLAQYKKQSNVTIDKHGNILGEDDEEAPF